MWAKYGSQSSDFSVGILFVTFCLAQAARVIGCPGVCINIKMVMEGPDLCVIKDSLTVDIIMCYELKYYWLRTVAVFV